GRELRSNPAIHRELPFAQVVSAPCESARNAPFESRRRSMAIIAVRILFTGKSSTQTTAILTRFGKRGWGSYGVDTVSESKTLMETFKFDVVLALEKLNDGRGYDLAEAVK